MHCANSEATLVLQVCLYVFGQSNNKCISIDVEPRQLPGSSDGSLFHLLENCTYNQLHCLWAKNTL